MNITLFIPPISVAINDFKGVAIHVDRWRIGQPSLKK
jgi:hypothetical protein